MGSVPTNTEKRKNSESVAQYVDRMRADSVVSEITIRRVHNGFMVFPGRIDTHFDAALTWVYRTLDEVSIGIQEDLNWREDGAAGQDD